MTEQQFSRLSSLSLDMRTVFCEYAYLQALSIHDTAVMARCTLLYPGLSPRPYINPCRSCHGAGEHKCSTCYGSGDCQKCRGTGQVFVEYGLRTRSQSRGYYSPCAPHCSSCGETGRRTCSACQGKRGSLDMQKIRKAQARLNRYLGDQITLELQQQSNTDEIPSTLSVADLFLR